MRAIRCHCTHAVSALWVAIAVAAILGAGACRRGRPVIDTGPKPVQADGTISGTVRGPQGTSAIEGRTVEVVNIATGEKQRVLTSSTGGFTFKVKPGKYRIDLTLRDGETVVKRPGIIDVNRSDVDASADFVIGAASVSRPRYRAPRADDGLGSAIA